MPKGYQITQYDRPLALDGQLEWTEEGHSRRVRILRVHIEEDAGKRVLSRMFKTGEAPDEVAAAEGLAQQSDVEALRTLVADVLARFPEQIAQFRAGRIGVAGFLIGHVMKASQGRANPGIVNRLVREHLLESSQ